MNIFHAENVRIAKIYQYVDTRHPSLTTQVKANFSPLLKLVAAVLIVLAVGIQSAQAREYTNEEIADAIYKAEGGKNTKKPYGILSVPCSSAGACRRICINTIKNNRIRHTNDVNFKSLPFLAYLSRKYAPIGAGNDPQGLNRHWLKNVRYFLAKEVR